MQVYCGHLKREQQSLEFVIWKITVFNGYQDCLNFKALNDYDLIQEELDDIIRYGSKELFADENDEAGKSRQIHYDDAAIDR